MPEFDDGSNYTVKEILTQFVLPQLKELKDQSIIAAEQVDTRVSRLEKTASQARGAIAFVVLFIIPVTLVPAAYAAYGAIK